MGRWDFKPGKKHHDYPLWRKPAMMRGGFKPYKPPKVLDFKKGGGIWDILGSIAGPVVGAGASMMGAGPVTSGLLSGLTGTLATGDLGRGVASGLTGYGLGQAIDQFAAAGVDPASAAQQAGQSPVQTKGTGSYTGHPGDLTRDQAAAWDRVSGIPDQGKLTGGEKWDAVKRGMGSGDAWKNIFLNQGLKTSLPLGLGIWGSIPQRYAQGGSVISGTSDELYDQNRRWLRQAEEMVERGELRSEPYWDRSDGALTLKNRYLPADPDSLEQRGFLSRRPETWIERGYGNGGPVVPTGGTWLPREAYADRSQPPYMFADGGRVMNAPPPVSFQPGVDPEWNWFNRGNINQIAGDMLGNGPGLTSATNTPPSTGPATPIWNNETGGPNAPTGGVSAGPANSVAQAIATGLSLASPAPAGTIGTIASALGMMGIQGQIGMPGIGVVNDQSSNNVTADVAAIANAIATSPSVQGMLSAQEGLNAAGNVSGLTGAGVSIGEALGGAAGDAGGGIGAAGAAAGEWRHGGLVRRYNSGGLIGPGDGQSDSIPAMIDGQQPAALSTGEYVIPSWAVSAIGKGDTNAGIKYLDQMVQSMQQNWRDTIGDWKPRGQ